MLMGMALHLWWKVSHQRGEQENEDVEQEPVTSLLAGRIVVLVDSFMLGVLLQSHQLIAINVPLSMWLLGTLLL